MVEKSQGRVVSKASILSVNVVSGRNRVASAYTVRVSRTNPGESVESVGINLEAASALNSDEERTHEEGRFLESTDRSSANLNPGISGGGSGSKNTGTSGSGGRGCSSPTGSGGDAGATPTH